MQIMEILKVMILEKLIDKFGHREVYIYEIRKFLNISLRIPTNVCYILISELVKEGNMQRIKKEGRSKFKVNESMKKMIKEKSDKLNKQKNCLFIK
jgi:hypothetical protein